MKKICSFIFSISLSVVAYAQLYQPFPVDSAGWREQWNSNLYPMDDRSDFLRYLDGDSIVGTFTYHKVYQDASASQWTIPWTGPYTLYDGPWPGPIHSYVGAYREDTLKHIYFLQPGDTLAKMLYDFNLAVGDTLPATCNNDTAVRNYVSAIDSILLGSTYHKRYHISCTAPVTNDYVNIIEGVGSIFGMTAVLRPVFESTDDLLCFSRRGISLYKKYAWTDCEMPGSFDGLNDDRFDQVEVFPNPATDILIVRLPQTRDVTAVLADALGQVMITRQLTSENTIFDLKNFPRGIYFLKTLSEKGSLAVRKIILN